MDKTASEGRQQRHIAVFRAVSRLTMSVDELEELLFRINPGLRTPSTVKQIDEDKRDLSFSEVWMDLEGSINSISNRVREIKEAMESQLF